MADRRALVTGIGVAVVLGLIFVRWWNIGGNELVRDVCTGLFKSPACYALAGNEDEDDGAATADTLAAINPAMDLLSDELTSLYVGRLDQWVASGGNLEQVQSEVVDTCGRLILVTADAQRRAELNADANAWALDADICAKITVHRVHPQPEFSNPEIVGLVCEGTNSLFRALCARAGIAATSR